MNADQLTTSPTLSPEVAAAAESKAGDVIVLVAMAIVAAAAGVAFAVQGGLPPGGAVGAGCALFAVFVAGHAVTKRGAKRAPPARAARRVRKPATPSPSADHAPRLPGVVPQRSVSVDAEPDSAEIVELPSSALGSLAPTSAELAAEPQPLPPELEASIASLKAAVSPLPGEPSFSPPPLASPSLASYAPPPVGSIQSYWSYAPGAPRFEGTRDAGAPAAQGQEAGAVAGPALRTPLVPLGDAVPRSAAEPPAIGEAARDEEPSYPRREDVEVIQSLIKKLADEVNATEQREAALEPPPVPVQAGGIAHAPAAVSAEDPIEASLSALRTTAGAMRRGAAPRLDADEASLAAARDARHFPAAAAPTAPVPPPLPVAPGRARIAALSEAIAAGRMDVLLEPIMGLDDNRARHYEVTVRLRGASGEALSPDDNRGEIEGHRILPLIDAMKIVRTANVAARLAERGKDGSVFSTYAGESLSDNGFLDEVSSAIAARPSTAGQLVLSFSQGDVRGFEAPEWGALAGLRALGFRFALADVTDLDMDFDVIARCGFAFVKLDADVFLEGLMAPSGLVPAGDVCRHLASQGLALVVDRIDSDYKRGCIFGFGVLLGQGQLFGVPRPMKVDAVAGHRDAAA